ncbi:MAG: glycosyltransferase [Pseudomonadota bacterium]
MPIDNDADKQIARLRSHIAALEEERTRLRHHVRDYQRIFDRVSDQLAAETPSQTGRQGSFEGLTFVIAYYDIPRQIERTLVSCSPAFQGVAEDEVEVVIVDNGSPVPLPQDLQERFPHVRRVIRVEGHPSPCVALNQGIAAASRDAIAIMIDGAHMLSPGIVRNVRDLWALFANPVINVPQLILGAESQNLTTATDAFDRESARLKSLGWPADGYAPFNYAVYPGESYHRSAIEAVESNCLITTRRVLDTHGGFDERFDEPGAGFANLELFSRLIHAPGNTFITLPGEGSFHQDHRGVTTHRSPEERDRLVERFRDRHREITGGEPLMNARSPFLFGKTRRITQRIPTISQEFGKVSHKVMRQLADVYTARIRQGMHNGPRPALAFGGAPDERVARPPLAPRGLAEEAAARNGVEVDALDYLRCLTAVHRTLEPSLYFEVGIDTGASLRIAACRSIGVDPAYWVSTNLTQPVRLFRQTSDVFFQNEQRCRGLFRDGIDLAFIDGMHLAEYVLRDFIATERWMRPGGVVLVDDVLPEQPEMLDRERRFDAWCGDVYKIVPVLRRYRPDLRVSVFETFVGPYRKGLAVISGLDPQNRVLEERYAEIEAEILADAYDVPDIAALEALLAPEPIRCLETAVRGGAADLAARIAAPPPEEVARGAAFPESPRLSVVVVAYGMARELPRTLETLSARMQRGLGDADYEIIVVDNGSPEPADAAALVSIAPNARVVRLHEAMCSPCGAANAGIALARAERIGVLIDGARMASPGLLQAALDALADETDRVVGAHGFHLGQDVQQDAVRNGYDAAAEDALLASAGWQQDGYRLFDVSVFSKSSGDGWRTLPSESNALFMHRDRWHALNGYDERFASAGGGLANLDLWKRACEASGVEVTMLLGEGTFHQVHGGATTGSAISRREAFDREYERLRGRPYQRPAVEARFVGKEPAPARSETVEAP